MKEFFIYNKTREALHQWQLQLIENILLPNDELMHSFHYYFPGQSNLISELKQFANTVAAKLEPVVIENNIDSNLPTLQSYDAFGNFNNSVNHHPDYITAGNLIYGSKLMEKFAACGKLTEGLAFLLLSSHAGEAGHNCPIACSAGILRILNKTDSVPNKNYYINKLIQSSFSDNFTGAQFLTEIQGGSDVGANACIASQDADGIWYITGEKWFCSNANADLILMTARFDETVKGTKGLGLFLVPAKLDKNTPNQFIIRRLKQKIGTRSMATAEIDFDNAIAIPIGDITEGIHLVLENVLHLSRICNAFSVIGMTRRAFQIAYYYAKNRRAFGSEIINYPLVKQQLAGIKSICTAQLAACFAIARLQDQFDISQQPSTETKLILRLLVNLNKYFTAKYTVDNIRHCIDILAGNGTIQTFSTLPRLLCDAIVCENWEGTHFTLWMQILRDIERFEVDELFITYIKSQLHAVDPHNEFHQTIVDELDLLSQKLITLKTAEAKIKTLQIESIVLHMAVIYSALMLLKEAEDQKNYYNNPAKYDCLRFFIHLFFTNKKLPHDQIYNDLLADLIP